MADDDIVHLIDDPGDEPPPEEAQRWKVAVIDDEPAVHDGTRFALADYKLNGQGLEIISAYSAAEGRELMRKHPDVAVVLLDVIMESDAAGLDLVQFIRNHLKNDTVRIILRTGQPGQAPERRVIVDYDINDYKAKTELTADKLFTALTAALRSYEQLQRMVETRRGLEIIIEAASTLFDFKSMQRLAEGVLTQIASLLNAHCAGILVLREGQNAHETFSVLAGSGCYSRFIGTAISEILENDLRKLVEEAFARRQHEFSARRSVLYIKTLSGRAAAGGERPPRGTRGAAHAGPDFRQPAAGRAMGAAAASQYLQERDPRHRRPRFEESAGGDPRPHRNIEGNGRRGRRARRQHADADCVYPQRRQPAHRDGR